MYFSCKLEMMKKFLLPLILIAFGQTVIAQSFSLEDESLFAAIELNSDDEYTLDIYNDADYDILLTWELTNYNVPTSWLMQICDNKQCYSNHDGANIPNSAEMNPIVVDDDAFLKITPEPGDAAYYAVLEFDIFENF